MVDELHCELSDDAMIIFSLSSSLTLSLFLPLTPCLSLSLCTFLSRSLSHSLSLSLPFSLQRDFMFTSGAPLINSSESVPEGIKWPVANSGSSSNRSQDVQQSVCAIVDYLGNHMPQIIGTFMKDPNDNLTTRIRNYNKTFKAAARHAGLHTDPPHCELRRMAQNDFQKKMAGLKILYYSRRWVEDFTNATCIPRPLV